MALAMLRPFATKSGSYYLNVRVPLALHPLAKGQRVSLPAGDEHRSIGIGDKVVFSLRTKAPKVAKERVPLALNALNAFFESLGRPPQSRRRMLGSSTMSSNKAAGQAAVLGMELGAAVRRSRRLASGSGQVEQ